MLENIQHYDETATLEHKDVKSVALHYWDQSLEVKENPLTGKLSEDDVKKLVPSILTDKEVRPLLFHT